MRSTVEMSLAADLQITSVSGRRKATVTLAGVIDGASAATFDLLARELERAGGVTSVRLDMACVTVDDTGWDPLSCFIVSTGRPVVVAGLGASRRSLR